jgi:hypothetical protein
VLLIDLSSLPTKPSATLASALAFSLLNFRLSMSD